MPDVVDAWWSATALDRVWATIAARLEGQGLEVRGHVTIADLDLAERRAVSDLLGRTVLGASVRVDLSVLDRRLRERAGYGLVGAAQQVRGALIDQTAVRAGRAAHRKAGPRAYQEFVEAHPGAAWPWADDWLIHLQTDGVLGREPDPGGLIRSALMVLWDRRSFLNGGPVAVGASPAARTELAARLFGDAHALDDDRRLAGAVLRAVDAAGLGDGLSRRGRWERMGVLADAVSSTCLTLGLQTAGGRADDPRHVTWWDLRHGMEFAAGQAVTVCENPRVLEAVAEQAARSRRTPPALVCASGRPALVTMEVLGRLAERGGRLRYHGDFDWPGVAMANQMHLQFGAEPWLMSADAYLSAPASLVLTGAAVEPEWDRELGPAMRYRGLAVHEESLLPGLVDALEADWGPAR